MKVWELLHDFQVMRLVEAEKPLFDYLEDFSGNPMKDTWTSMKIKVERKGKL